MSNLAPRYRDRCRKTYERRERLIALLKDGRRIQGEKLREAVMPDRSKVAFQLFIRGMRDDGYDIRADGPGHCCRGYVLNATPHQTNA